MGGEPTRPATELVHTRTPTSRPHSLRSLLNSLILEGLPNPPAGTAASTKSSAVTQVTATPQADPRAGLRRQGHFLASSLGESALPQLPQLRAQSKLRGWSAGPGASFPDCGRTSPRAAGGAGY